MLRWGGKPGGGKNSLVRRSIKVACVWLGPDMSSQWNHSTNFNSDHATSTDQLCSCDANRAPYKNPNNHLEEQNTMKPTYDNSKAYNFDAVNSEPRTKKPPIDSATLGHFAACFRGACTDSPLDGWLQKSLSNSPAPPSSSAQPRDSFASTSRIPSTPPPPPPLNCTKWPLPKNIVSCVWRTLSSVCFPGVIKGARSDMHTYIPPLPDP